MNQRVLFVDDDQMLLSSMERCLGLQFELDTALSGTEALEKIDSAGNYAVIVSDMRMPLMNGIEFIQEARQRSPESVYLMLTGNQDIQTAARAVNEGQVKQFLNKPCDPSEIASAIDLALCQYDFKSTERELLNKTFVGAVAIFTDMLETLKPDLLGRAGRVVQVLELLLKQLGLTPRWEYKIAGQLSQLGFALLPAKDFEGVVDIDPTDPAAVELIQQACDSSAGIVERVPRLDRVAAIIRASAECHGGFENLDPTAEQDVVAAGASLLYAARIVEWLTSQKASEAEAHRVVDQHLQGADAALINAAKEIYPVELSADHLSVPLDQLKPGMVLYDDALLQSGRTLLNAGRRLSATHIEKLRSEGNALTEPNCVNVTQRSYSEHTDQQSAVPAIA